MRYYTPLRYPGGKAKLGHFMRQVFVDNELLDGAYVEPYAGGAAVGLELLMTGYARDIWLNDIDPAIYAFWQAALYRTEELIERIETAPLTIDEWQRQRSIYLASVDNTLDLGFSAFFLNRTNRSGILKGGVIGGRRQTGRWLMDARFNRTALVRRIRRLSHYRDRIHLFCEDAEGFLQNIALSERSLVYIDPPYFRNGQRLYRNHYVPDDHARIAEFVQKKLPHRWIVSYDDDNEVAKLYRSRRCIRYSLQYSAQQNRKGGELIIFSDGLYVPKTREPGAFRVN